MGPDQFNQSIFQPVKTISLRLVLTRNSINSAGIEEWQVYRFFSGSTKV